MSGSEPTVTASRSCFLDLGDEGKMSAVGKAPCVCLRPSLFFSTRRAHAAIVEIQCQLIPFLHARHVVSVIQRNKRKKVGRNEVLDPGTRRGGRKRRSASFDRSTSKASTKKPARRTPREERESKRERERGAFEERPLVVPASTPPATRLVLDRSDGRSQRRHWSRLLPDVTSCGPRTLQIRAKSRGLDAKWREANGYK